MKVGSKLLRRGLAAGLAAVAVLGVIFGLAVWNLGGPAVRPRPSGAGARLLSNPRPLTFWERANLLLLRSHSARAGARNTGDAHAAGGQANGAGAGLQVGAAPGQASAGRDPYRETAADDARDLAAAEPVLPPDRRRA